MKGAGADVCSISLSVERHDDVPVLAHISHAVLQAWKQGMHLTERFSIVIKHVVNAGSGAGQAGIRGCVYGHGHLAEGAEAAGGGGGVLPAGSAAAPWLLALPRQPRRCASDTPKWRRSPSHSSWYRNS